MWSRVSQFDVSDRALNIVRRLPFRALSSIISDEKLFLRFRVFLKSLFRPPGHGGLNFVDSSSAEVANDSVSGVR